MRCRHVILDWSGTLVNDLPPVLHATNHVLATFGLPALSEEEFRREFCLPVRRFYDRRLPEVPHRELERVFFAEFHRRQDEITLLPDTLQFLDYCRSTGVDVWIASTVDPVTYSRQAQRFGVDRYVTRSYTGIEDKTQTIHVILADNRIAPAEALFVGDMEHDIAAGKAGGTRTCAVLTGYTLRAPLEAAEPDLICRNLSELQAHLSEHETVYG